MLTAQQLELYNQLLDAIRNNGNVAEILQGVSKEDFLSIFREKVQDNTLLYTASIILNLEALKDIFNAAEEKGVLKEIVTEEILSIQEGGTDVWYSLVDNIIQSRSRFPSRILIAIKESCGLEAFWKVISEEDRKNIKDKLKNENGNRDVGMTAKDKDILKEIYQIEENINMHSMSEDLTQEQKDLHTRLEEAISSNKSCQDVTDLLKEVSGGDLLAVLRATETGGRTINLFQHAYFIKSWGAHEALYNAAIGKEVSLEGIPLESKEPGKGILLENKYSETKIAANKSIIIGSVCGVIAALAVGGGCFAAGIGLPMLAIVGIAVAAALVVGLVAGGITYAISEPSNKLDEPDSDKVASATQTV